MLAGFGLTRPALLSLDDLARIEGAAVGILGAHGVRVIDPDLRTRLSGAGFAERGDRVLLEPMTVTTFLAEERARNGDAFGPAPAPPHSDEPIRLSTIQYPLQVHDLASDRIVPFTTERLIEAVKLVDALHDRSVSSSPPGTPCDAPPALQPVLQYWVAATYSRQGRRPPDAKAGESMPYVFEMADVLGHPVRSLPVYVFSPLALCGESLRCVFTFRDRLDGVGVSSMPSLGFTAPIAPLHAFALAAAEVIGSAILVRELTGLPVHWHVNLFPIDLGSMAMIFGSPESLLLELMSQEVSAHFRGEPYHPGADALHTNAKLPGAQSCAEKSSVMTAGALLGSRNFGSGGSLSLDEVFSAEQMLYDLEIRDHVQRLLRGFEGSCDVQSCLDEVAEALDQGSFAGLDSTLHAHRETYWRPTLFRRDFLGAWQSRGEPSPRAETRALIRRLVEFHDYHLADSLQAALDEILTRAKSLLR